MTMAGLQAQAYAQQWWRPHNRLSPGTKIAADRAGAVFHQQPGQDISPCHDGNCL